MPLDQKRAQNCHVVSVKRVTWLKWVFSKAFNIRKRVVLIAKRMTPYLQDSPMFLWLHTIFYYNLAAQYFAKWPSCKYCTYLRGVSNASEYCAIVLKGELLGWPVSTAHCIVLNCIVLCCIETRVNIIDWTSELCVQCTPRHGVRRKPGMWLLTRGRGGGEGNTGIMKGKNKDCPAMQRIVS